MLCHTRQNRGKVLRLQQIVHRQTVGQREVVLQRTMLREIVGLSSSLKDGIQKVARVVPHTEEAAEQLRDGI